MKNTIILLSCFYALQISAQKEDYVWVLGSGIGSTGDSLFSTTVIDFNESPPAISLLYKFTPAGFTKAGISSPEGFFQCHTNGVNIINAAFEVLENGEEFQSSSTYPGGYVLLQGALFLPFPEHPGKFIFLLCDVFSYQSNNTLTSGCRPLTYSVVDMNANGGSGEVLEKKIPLTYDTLHFGQLTAIRHGNGRDWWMLAPSNKGGTIFHKFLATPEGILWDHAQSVGDSINLGLGQAAISPNGEWYALYNLWGLVPVYGYHAIDLYRLDRCSGMLSDHIHIQDTIYYPGGVAFSPSSRFMYASRWDKIYQWDLHAPDIAASKTLVAEYDGFLGDFNLPTRFFNMKLAPDGKIYISVSNYNSRYLHVIEQPDVKGMACNVLQHHIQLPTFNRFSLPNHPVTRLGALEGSPCDTLVNEVEEPTGPHTAAWSVYPNPATSSITLACTVAQDHPLRWALYDALGRELLSRLMPQGQTEWHIPLDGAPEGLYFYKIDRDGQTIHTGKLMIER